MRRVLVVVLLAVSIALAVVASVQCDPPADRVSPSYLP